MAERRCLVAVCHNLPMVYTQTSMSLQEMGWGERIPQTRQAHGFDAIDLKWFTSWPRVDALRDEALLAAQQHGYTHLIFLDADMAWPTNVLHLLLRHAGLERTIVSGVYVQKQYPYAPVVMQNGVNRDGVMYYEHADVLSSEGELVNAEVVGMGCCLIPLAVLDDLGPRPWFEYKDDAQGWPRVTEDVPFCQKVTAAGWSIVADPLIQCIHYHIVGYDIRHTRRVQAMVAEADKHTRVTMVPAAEGSAA